MGYECYVNDGARIIHYEGMSSKSLSLVQTATKPAARRGSIIFFSEGKWLLGGVLSILYTSITLMEFIVHFCLGVVRKRPNKYHVLALGEWNIIKTSFSRKSPKDIFAKYYKKIKE